MWAVSYTHLDVYKRQVLILGPGPLPELGVAGAAIATVTAQGLSLIHISFALQ